MLIQLIYISTPVVPTVEATKQFIPLAKRVNDSFDITGMILSDPDEYIQVLEGEQDIVDTLFAKISADPRHTGVRLIRYMPIPTREFSKWSMRHVRVKNLRTLSDHDAIKLLYTTNDKELSVVSVRTILASSLAGIAILFAVVIGGPLLESRYAPALKNVTGSWVEIKKANAIVLVTGTRVRKGCHLEGFYVSTKTESGRFLAHTKILELSPETNERFVAKLETFPSAEEYRIEIRHTCQPLWSQSQKVDMDYQEGSRQVAKVRSEESPS